MKHQLTLLCMVLAIVFNACTKASPDEILPLGPSSRSVTISAQLPDLEVADQDSRASLALTVRLYWHEGDAVSVINLTTGKAISGNLISNQEGSRTTFSGTLTGTISSTDNLLFIYPCQNYTAEEDFSGISLDGYFSEQSGTDASTIPFIAMAKGTLEELSVSSEPLDFAFGMSFFQVNMANLPESGSLPSVTLSGFCNSVDFSLSNGEFVPTYTTGNIQLSPEVSTNEEGCRTLFFTCLPQSTSTRSLTARIGTSKYVSTVPSSSISPNTSYNLNLSEFTKTEITPATYTVSTNYGTYQTYNLSNAYDGNSSTYFWSSEAQASGKYVLITFSEDVKLKSFTTTSSHSTDFPRKVNKLQVSTDGSSWTDVGTFPDTATSSFTDINRTCKYVRIYASSSSNYWLVLNEISMEYDTL